MKTLLIIAAILLAAVYGYMKISGRSFFQTQKDIKEKVEDTYDKFKNNNNNNKNY